MHTARLMLVTATALLLLPAVTASAQQSAVCVTPSVTCRATFLGPSGAACACQTPRGWVRGRLA